MKIEISTDKCRPQIKTPPIPNRDRFPESCGEDYNPLNHHKLILRLGITIEQQTNKSLINPIFKSI